MNANPMNKNNLARHTALESPKPSSPRILSLSIMLMMKYPMSEQMPGIQSTKVTWTGGSSSPPPGLPHGFFACAERIAASKNVQFAIANYHLCEHVARGEAEVSHTRAPAMYTPIALLCFPRVRFGNGFKHTLLGS